MKYLMFVFLFFGTCVAQAEERIAPISAGGESFEKCFVESAFYRDQLSLIEDTETQEQSVQKTFFKLESSPHKYFNQSHHSWPILESVRSSEVLPVTESAQELPKKSMLLSQEMELGSVQHFIKNHQKKRPIPEHDLRRTAEEGAVWIQGPWGASRWQIERSSERDFKLP
ncbi:hypothetical protein [uncultured Rubinisphaera sp.]|uniref:hypothetical protein n=1 Tax=uncultured Rubinisphaera sp. TaxID=1678686 RepID=UPI0030D87084